MYRRMKKLVFITFMLVGIGLQAQSYAHYESLHDKYKKKASLGATFTGIGVGIFAASYVMGFTANSNGDDALLATAGLGFITSFVFFNVGVPLWAVNGAKKRANRREMEKWKPEPAIKEIAIGTTNNGIGLIVKL